MCTVMNPERPFMHSPSYPPPRSSSGSHYSTISAERPGVRKSSSVRARSTSGPHAAQQLEHLLPEQFQNNLNLSPGNRSLEGWTASRHSPQPHPFFEPMPRASATWSLGSTSRTGSGNPVPSTDAAPRTYSTTASSIDSGIGIGSGSLPPTTTVSDFNPMSYMMSSQYAPMGTDASTMGTGGYRYDPSFRASYPSHPAQQDYNLMHTQTPFSQAPERTSSPMPAYAQHTAYDVQGSYSVSPGTRSSTLSQAVLSPFAPGTQRAASYVYPAVSERPSNVYDTNIYASPSLAPSQTMSSQVSTAYGSSQSGYEDARPQTFSRSLSQGSAVQASSQKPRPQCWEHGCNGREFSTFSNLLRHQREKSGTASKSYCPRCGAEFTRTTARNGHLAHEKCTKQRRGSDDT